MIRSHFYDDDLLTVEWMWLADSVLDVSFFRDLLVDIETEERMQNYEQWQC